MSDISIEKQENNIIQIWLYTLLKQCTQTLYTHMVYFGCVSGVCHDWQFDFWPYFHHALACVCTGFSASWMRLCIAQLHVAGSHRYFLTTFEAKLNGMFDWFAGGWSRYWKYIFVCSFPSLLLLGFIFSSFNSLNLEVRPEIKQSDHLALAPALVYPFFMWKSSVLTSNSNGNIFGLLYSSYLYFEWVKIASLCQCFWVFIFLSCAAKNSACHLGISRLLSCRFRGHDMTNKEYALRRGVQWTFSIHSAYLLKNQSQNKKLSRSVWIAVINISFDLIKSETAILYTFSKKWKASKKKIANFGRFMKNLATPSFNSFL